jgi:hypothetical protein
MKRALAALVTMALAITLLPVVVLAADSTDGTWIIQPARSGEKVQLELRWDGEESDNYNSSFRLEDLGLQRRDLDSPAHSVHFVVRRDAGTIDFNGSAGDGVGSGRFTFSPSSAYRDAMAKRGYDIPNVREQLAALTLDISLSYTDAIAATGVKPSSYGNLIAYRALGITPQSIADLRRQFGSLGEQDVITFSALHIDAGYIKELASVGYTNLSAHEITELRALHVDADYIRRVQAHGYKHPTVRQLVELKAMRIL